MTDRLGAFLGPLITHPTTRAVDARDGGLGADDASTRGQPPGTTTTSHPGDGDGDSLVNPDDEIRAIYTIVESDDQVQLHVKRHPNDIIRDEVLFDEEEKQRSQDKETRGNGIVVRLMPSRSTAYVIDPVADGYSPYPPRSECTSCQERKRVPKLEGVYCKCQAQPTSILEDTQGDGVITGFTIMGVGVPLSSFYLLCIRFFSRG